MAAGVSAIANMRGEQSRKGRKGKPNAFVPWRDCESRFGTGLRDGRQQACIASRGHLYTATLNTLRPRRGPITRNPMMIRVHQKQAVPVIETARLFLRGPRPADLPDSVALWSDPVVTRYTSGKPLSEEEVWGRLLRYVGHWAWMGFGYWVVEEKATGRFAGEMGFSD